MFEYSILRELKQRTGKTLSIILSVAMLVSMLPADLLGGIASVKAANATELKASDVSADVTASGVLGESMFSAKLADGKTIVKEGTGEAATLTMVPGTDITFTAEKAGTLTVYAAEGNEVSDDTSHTGDDTSHAGDDTSHDGSEKYVYNFDKWELGSLEAVPKCGDSSHGTAEHVSGCTYNATTKQVAAYTDETHTTEKEDKFFTVMGVAAGEEIKESGTGTGKYKPKSTPVQVNTNFNRMTFTDGFAYGKGLQSQGGATDKANGIKFVVPANKTADVKIWCAIARKSGKNFKIVDSANKKVGDDMIASSDLPSTDDVATPYILKRENLGPETYVVGGTSGTCIIYKIEVAMKDAPAANGAVPSVTPVKAGTKSKMLLAQGAVDMSALTDGTLTSAEKTKYEFVIPSSGDYTLSFAEGSNVKLSSIEFKPTTEEATLELNAKDLVSLFPGLSVETYYQIEKNGFTLLATHEKGGDKGWRVQNSDTGIDKEKYPTRLRPNGQIGSLENGACIKFETKTAATLEVVCYAGNNNKERYFVVGTAVDGQLKAADVKYSMDKAAAKAAPWNFTDNKKEHTVSVDLDKADTYYIYCETDGSVEFLAFKVTEREIKEETPGTTDTTDTGDGSSDTGDGTGDGLDIRFKNGDVYTYTGSAIKPEMIVRNNGQKLVEGVDYTIKYSNNVKVAKNTDGKKAPTVTITGKGIFAGKVAKTFTIKAASVANIPGMGAEYWVQKGKAAKLTLFFNGVKMNAKDIQYDTKKKWDADGELEIKGVGNFEGTVKMPIKAVDKDKLDKFALVTGAAKEYNAKDQWADIAKDLKVNPKKTSGVVENTDYFVSYTLDTTNAGTVKIAVMGRKALSGCNMTKAVKINPCKSAGSSVKITGLAKDYEFNSNGVTLDFNKLKVNFDGSFKETLVNGRDFKVTYSKNKKVGAATANLAFMGNYKGSKKLAQSFTIVAGKLANAEVYAPNMTFKKAAAYKTKPIVMLNGALLKTSEYKVQYSLDGKTFVDKPDKLSAAGTMSVKIVPKKAGGNVEGESAAVTYTVQSTGTDLSKAKVTVTPINGKKNFYTGKALEPKVSVSGASEGTYDVIYVNNVNKGKGTIIIQSKDGSCGSKTATFAIVAGDVSVISNKAKAVGTAILDALKKLDK